MRSFVNKMQLFVTDLTPCVFCGNILIDVEPFGKEQVFGGWVELPEQPELLQVGVVVVAAKKVKNPTRILNSGPSLM